MAEQDADYNLGYLVDEFSYNGCPVFLEEMPEDHVGRERMSSLIEIMGRILPDLPKCIEFTPNKDNYEEVTACKIQQITMILTRLFQSADQTASEITPIEQLAMIVQIRRIVGNARKVNTVAIHQNT